MSQSGQEGTGGTDSEQGTGAGTGGTGGTGTESSGTTDGSTGTGTGTDGAQGTGKGTEQETVARADFERTQRQLAEADRKREAAETELKQLKQKDLSELEKAQTEAKEATERAAQLEEEVSTLRLSNAFLASNTITWQNGEVALDIARSKGYLEDVVDDKGSVDSKKLVAALKKLSEDHKYLVKSDDGEEETKQGASGQGGMGRRSDSTDDKAKTQRLTRTFPALGRR